MSNKKAYFQGGGGVNEPAPKKKKYKSDKAIVVQPRFKEPFYRNYDVYDPPGFEHGPGAGWHSMDQYKSVSEFLKHRRKKLKDKYKADDSWIEDTEENRKERIKKMKTRARMFNKLIKIANKVYTDVNLIDFPIDDQINSSPIIGDSGTYSDAVPIGGQLDEYLTLPDFEGKLPSQLDFGRDYVEDEKSNDLIDKLEKKYLSPKENGLYGLPDGMNEEDLDADKTVNHINPEYGETDSGNTLYDKTWI